MLGKAGKYADQCRNEGFIGVDFLPDIDLSMRLSDVWQEFNKVHIPIWMKYHPDRSKIAAGLACGNLWTVCKGLQIDDIVLSSNDTNNFDPQYIKIKVDNDAVTTLSALTNSKIKTSITLAAQDSMDISLRVWLASNTPNSEIGNTFTSELVISGQASDTTSNYGVSAASYITNLSPPVRLLVTLFTFLANVYVIGTKPT